MTTLRDLTARITLESHGHEELEKLGEQLEGIHKKVEFLAGVELVKGLYELAERFSGVGEQLESASASAGMTTERFQQLAFAASQNAVSQEELGGALARFSRTLGSARDGSKEALAQFAKVGIGREQIAGFADAGDAMMALSDKVKDIHDPIKRTQVLMELLGRGSAHMTKLMSQGGTAIRDKMRQAGQIGAVVSQESIENLANMEDAVSALGGVFKATAADMAGYFAPAIIEVVHRIQEFWAANHKVIEERFEAWAEKAAFALGFVIGMMQAAGTALFAFADKHKHLINMVSDVIFKFLEFKIAVGLIAATGSFILGPFKQISSAFGVINGALKIFKTVGPWVKEYGPMLNEWVVGFAEGVTLLDAILAAGAIALFVVAMHDLYIFMTDGNVEDMWLYQLIMAIKGLGLTALKKLGLYDPDKDAMDAAKAAAMTMELAPVGDPNYNGPAWDFASSAKYRASDIMDNIGDLSHAQNAPPLSLSAGLAGGAAGPVTYNLDAPITINVPANADPRAISIAAKEGLTDHLNDVLRDAHTNQKQGLDY